MIRKFITKSCIIWFDDSLLVYIQVYEENDGILTEVASPLCGKDFPKEISTVNNSMVVKYKSDNSSNGQGFHMYYKAVKNGLYLLIYI